MVINSHPLYQLSYQGICRCCVRRALIKGRDPLVSTAPFASSKTLARLRKLDLAALAGIHEAVVEALGRVLGGSPADRELDRQLRANRAWAPEERAAAAEALFGVGLWRRRLAHHAHDSAEPRVLLAHFLRDLVGLSDEEARRLSGLADPLAAPLAPPESLAVRWSVPDPLARILQAELGEELEPFLEAINRPGPICLRANLLRITREALQARLAEEGVQTDLAPYASTALIARERFNVYGSPSHQAGLFEIQDEGSQLLGVLVGARPGETVLDLCAGAGGKTLLLAAQLQNEGTLLAYDPDAERLDRLWARAERAGVRNLRIVRALEPGSVDRVLVDAPCSELGALRRGPDLRHRMDVAAFDAFPPLQREILERAAPAVKTGGLLVYATCTLRREENEDVVHAFLADHPEFVLLTPGGGPFSESFGDGEFFRALPHRHGTDGFFGAVMTRV